MTEHTLTFVVSLYLLSSFMQIITLFSWVDATIGNFWYDVPFLPSMCGCL